MNKVLAQAVRAIVANRYALRHDITTLLDRDDTLAEAYDTIQEYGRKAHRARVWHEWFDVVNRVEIFILNCEIHDVATRTNRLIANTNELIEAQL